jgi:hypothetical protein
MSLVAGLRLRVGGIRPGMPPLEGAAEGMVGFSRP